MRYFNTAGPIRNDEHYCLPPMSRLNLKEIEALLAQKKYFILHAPRQTGKTSCLLALRDYLNQRGQYKCLYINVENAQIARENVDKGMQTILGEMATRAEISLQDLFLQEQWLNILRDYGGGNALGEILYRWCKTSSRPLVLLIDEIDALVGDTLISVLRQLRSRYDVRPGGFPQSIILCGLRDVRDYRIHSSKEKAIITGGSAFNIKAKSLRLGDFTRAEIEKLYQYHTLESGQHFEPEVLDFVWNYTEGQPWLVNALGYETCFEGSSQIQPVTLKEIQKAKENLILRRETHLDQLIDKLREERVHRVIAPILSGGDAPSDIPIDDIMYVRDLGLIKDYPHLRIANRLYQEVIPRELTLSTQLTITHESAWYVDPNGRLNMEKLLKAFQNFFRKFSETWLERFQYKEAGPQLLLQAFLQRVLNSGGEVQREYGLGTRRTDLLVLWNYAGSLQEVVIELKIRYGALETTITQGLEQTAAYMDKCGTMDGFLIIFDRTRKTWEEKIFHRSEEYQGKKIIVWGM